MLTGFLFIGYNDLSPSGLFHAWNINALQHFITP